VTDDEIKALKDLRRTIDRWRRMVEEAEGATDMEREAILDALHTDIGEVMHTRLHRFDWWSP
jgi:hypothetical protein